MPFSGRCAPSPSQLNRADRAGASVRAGEETKFLSPPNGTVDVRTGKIRLKKPYRVIEKEFASRLDAKIWIIENQFGRRNLPTYTRGELALKLESMFREKAAANLKIRTGGVTKAKLPQSQSPILVRKEVAKIAGMGERTIDKVKVIAEHAPEAVKERLRRRATTRSSR
jgi:hypothetical protein